MLDAHCHLDRFEDPQAVAAQSAGRGVFMVAVTNLPRDFRDGVPHVRRLRRVRLALGLHPLAAAFHNREMADFERLFSRTSFIGEVGLDFSFRGKASAQQQLESFDRVVRLLKTSPKFVSVHSRGAESELLAVLAQHSVTHVVFHWYTGTVGTLERVLGDGHFLSVNPAMIRSPRGRAIIKRLPPDRLLTETDGPYCRVDDNPVYPWHVELVESYIAKLWKTSTAEIREQVWNNFQGILQSRAIGLLTPR